MKKKENDSIHIIRGVTLGMQFRTNKHVTIFHIQSIKYHNVIECISIWLNSKYSI